MSMNTVGRLFASKLPTMIKKARARAVEHPQLFLKGKATALVQVLITYTNLDHISSPLRFNRERPATLLGVSTRTIDRLLGELESLGWLTRLPQPRLRDGGWGCTSIAWSPWVIRDVFAIPPATDKWGSNVRKRQENEPSRSGQNLSAHRATKKAHLSFSPKGEVLRNKVEDDNSKKSPETTFDPFNEKVKQKRRIPEDLVEPMNELGLDPRSICVLMAQCKRKGKRLQEVFTATLGQLRERRLRGKDVLAWLLYMIGLDRDYAYESRQQHQRMREKQRSTKRAALLQRLADNAFRPGSTLPNGLVVTSRMNGVVTLSKPNGSTHGGAPEQALIESLALSHLSWARRVLRGQDAPTPATVKEPIEPNVLSPAKPVCETVDRRTILQSLADMKSILKAAPSFARVRY